jgi:hypothetical protein
MSTRPALGRSSERVEIGFFQNATAAATRPKRFEEKASHDFALLCLGGRIF